MAQTPKPLRPLNAQGITENPTSEYACFTCLDRGTIVIKSGRYLARRSCPADCKISQSCERLAILCPLCKENAVIGMTETKYCCKQALRNWRRMAERWEDKEHEKPPDGCGTADD